LWRPPSEIRIALMPGAAAPVTFQAQSLETAKRDRCGTPGFPWDSAVFRSSVTRTVNHQAVGPPRKGKRRGALGFPEQLRGV
jgi:hypothetical protein